LSALIQDKVKEGSWFSNPGVGVAASASAGGGGGGAVTSEANTPRAAHHKTFSP
jgi:hypothetical protein